MIESLLVFVSMSFGLFGIVNSHHTNVYNEAYEFWVDHKVFARKDCHINNPTICSPDLDLGSSPSIKPELCNKEICSKAESFVRKICRLNDINVIVLYTFYLISVITAIVIIYDLENMLKIYGVQSTSSSEIIEQRLDLIESAVALILTCIMIRAAHFLSKYNDFQRKVGSIDEKLFEVWWKHKCHRHKHEELLDNRQPIRMYRILAEEIYLGRITDATSDEKKLVDDLFPDIGQLRQPKMKNNW